MITQQQAEGIAAHLHGPRTEADDQAWRLMEFDHGWVIVKPTPPGQARRRGGATEVIERDGGHVVRFPSNVSLQGIVDDYPAVRHWGHEAGTAG